jgi:integrase
MNERKNTRRRAGRRDFGTIKAEGTPTAPAFSVRWYEGTRQRRKRGFGTRGEAGAFLARVRAAMGDGTLAVARRAEALFTDVGEEWLRLHSHALRSHRQNEIRWNKRLKNFFAGVSLTGMTVGKVLEFKAALLADETLANATRNQYLQQVRAILRYAVSTGYLTTSPTDRLRGLMIRVLREKLAPPIERPEDVGRLLEAVKALAVEQGCPSYSALFATAVYTGMRRGELCGLRWSDVDLDRRRIVVGRSHAGPTKSGQGRLVPIPSALVPTLAAWKLASGPRVLVFSNDNAGKWGAAEMHTKNSAARLARHLKDACRTAKLQPIRFHALRHVFASHYMMAGGNLLTLQRILGHSTPTITGEVYSHLAPNHLVMESDRLRFTAPAGEVIAMPAPAANAAVTG